MALNIYGNCNGSSGSKYDIWLGVTQNSQSVEDNKSNVTVKLYLKRNDGYDSSAYNLNESDNTVKLTVGGSVKVSKNIAVDTRNCATLTLAAWTGDVSHNDDGSLSLSVGGSFTMGGKSLTGGSVSGAFPCTDIPRASAVSLSCTSLNPGDSVTVSISSASKSFAHKITLAISDYNLNYNAAAGVLSKDFTVPVQWAQAVADGVSKYITVTLTTYKGTRKIGAKSCNLKLVIPATSEYKPDFTLSVARVDNSVPSDWGEYVKNKSQVLLDIKSLSLKYGAKAVSYSAAVGSVTKRSLPAVFDLTQSGSVTVSITVKDSRGFAVKKSAKITVCDYSEPHIDLKSLERCDENGGILRDGTSLLATYTEKFSSVNGKNSVSVAVKYRQSDSELFSGNEQVSSSPSVICKGAVSPAKSYVLVFTVADGITTQGTVTQVSVPSAAIPFNIRRGGTGASFGCYAERDNELTVGWDLRVDGSLVCEAVSLEPTVKATAMHGASTAFYIPCLNMCYVRLRVDAASDLGAGTNHQVAVLGRAPVYFTPLSVYIGGEAQRAVEGGVAYENGGVIVRSSHVIAAGEKIYVSGFFICRPID